jgi:hypothetical protein
MANSLPRFSRNYTRQGEYANPKTIIDQSPDIWANTISNLGNTISQNLLNARKGLSKTSQETQTYLDDNAKFIMEHYDEFSDNINNSGVRNPSLNRAGVYAIRMKGEAAMNMKKSTTREQQAEFSQQYSFWDNKLNELIALVQAGNTADQTYNEQFVEGYANANTPGGISTVGLNNGLSQQYQLAMPVRLGGTRNPREQWFFDPDDGYKIKTMYTSDQIDKAHKDGNIENPYVIADPKVLFAHESPRIDPIDKEFRDFVAQTFYDKDKKPLEQFLMKEESTVEYTDANGNKMQKIVKGWNEPAVLGAWTNYISAKSKSYAKYPNQAKALWDTVLRQGRDILTTDDFRQTIDEKTGQPTGKFFQTDTEDSKELYSGGYSLSASDGTPGTALTAIDTGIFAESMLSYAGQFMPPEGEVISKSKVVKPEQVTEGDKKENIRTRTAANDFKAVEIYLESEGQLPQLPTLPLFAQGILTNEGEKFKEDIQTLLDRTGGKLIGFRESDRTGRNVIAIVKYDGNPNEITISEDEMKSPKLFKAKLKRATGVDLTGEDIIKAMEEGEDKTSYYNQFKDNK